VTRHAARGRHLLLDLRGCAPQLLDDVDALAAILRAACEAIGASVLELTARRFEPQGVTAVAILAESHASIHTYPEHGAAFVDVFTCGGVDPRPAERAIAHALDATSWRVRIVDRGPAS
jgi:S-adenosylmethionine decarboxylase proenzyme